MSNLEDLKADIARNTKPTAMLGMDAATQAYLRDTMWPWLEAMVDESLELEADIDELETGVDEFVRADTAATLASPITLAAEIITALAPSIDKGSPLALKISEFGKQTKAALAKLEEITVMDDMEDDDDGLDEDEDEDEDEEDEDDEKEAE